MQQFLHFNKQLNISFVYHTSFVWWTRKCNCEGDKHILLPDNIEGLLCMECNKNFKKEESFEKIIEQKLAAKLADIGK